MKMSAATFHPAAWRSRCEIADEPRLRQCERQGRRRLPRLAGMRSVRRDRRDRRARGCPAAADRAAQRWWPARHAGRARAEHPAAHRRREDRSGRDEEAFRHAGPLCAVYPISELNGVGGSQDRVDQVLQERLRPPCTENLIRECRRSNSAILVMKAARYCRRARSLDGARLCRVIRWALASLRAWRGPAGILPTFCTMR